MVHKSQSALEYLVTYGWALLVIAAVIVIMYSLGIFTPAQNVAATITGFTGMGHVSAICYGNGVLRLALGNSQSQLIEITGISVELQNGTVANANPSTTINSEPFIPTSGSYSFSVPNACPPANSRYSLSVTVSYSEPETQFPGPYSASGTLTGTSSSGNIPAFVLRINNFAHPFIRLNNPNYAYTQGGYSYMNATQSISGTNTTYTVIMWVQSGYDNYSTYFPPSPNSTFIGGGNGVGLFGFNGYQALGVGWGWDTSATQPNQGISPYVASWHRCSPADTTVSISSATEFYNQKWVFLAYSVKAPNYYAQINGVGSSTVNTNSYTGGPQIRIGDEFPQCDERPFIGYISNVQLYNVVLSPSQINQAYSRGITGTPVVSNASLVAWWPLNGTTSDFSGNGYNGQLVNASFTSNYITT